MALLHHQLEIASIIISPVTIWQFSMSPVLYVSMQYGVHSVTNKNKYEKVYRINCVLYISASIFLKIQLTLQVMVSDGIQNSLAWFQLMGNIDHL